MASVAPSRHTVPTSIEMQSCFNTGMQYRLYLNAWVRTNGSLDLRTFLLFVSLRCSDADLSSSGPTALDALVFAYLHCIIHSKDSAIRVEVARRVNLVAWERRVQGQVRAAFQRRLP